MSTGNNYNSAFSPIRFATFYLLLLGVGDVCSFNIEPLPPSGPKTMAQCDEFSDEFNDHITALRLEIEQCGDQVWGEIKEAGGLREMSRLSQKLNRDCARRSGGFCETYACGKKIYYASSSCRSENVDFECALGRRTSKVSACRQDVREHQRRAREEEQERRKTEDISHEKSFSESEEWSQGAYWRARREDHQRLREKNFSQRAGHLGEGERLAVLADEKMRELRPAVVNSISQTGVKIDRTFGQFSSSLNDSERESSTINSLELSGFALGALGKAAPLAEIPANLIGNVFNANVDLLSSLDLSAGQPVPPNWSERYVKSALGAKNILTAILGPTLSAQTPQLKILPIDPASRVGIETASEGPKPVLTSLNLPFISERDIAGSFLASPALSDDQEQRR